MTVKTRKPRKKKVELHGAIHSGVIFIGDCQFFTRNPDLALDPTTGETVDVTPKDPLNPFNTIDRVMELVGDTEKNLEIAPYLPGRGVLLNTHLQSGRYTIKKKMKNGKLVGFTVLFKE
jgi:hypothetical protein